MNPVKFAGANVVFAKDQPEYLPLPAYVDATDQYGRTITCWKMSWWERLKAAATGRVYLTLMTFGRPIQPQILSVDYPLKELA